ncbi:MAG: hypothetical protein ACLP7I_01195, partial [Limisphaerales bacterium]
GFGRSTPRLAGRRRFCGETNSSGESQLVLSLFNEATAHVSQANVAGFGHDGIVKMPWRLPVVKLA